METKVVECLLADTRLGGDWGCVGVVKRATELRGTRLAYCSNVIFAVSEALQISTTYITTPQTSHDFKGRKYGGPCIKYT